MPKVIIIGGSYAGLKALGTIHSGKSSGLEVTLVTPSTHAYFNVAAPRLISETEKFEKSIVCVQEAVEKNSKGRARFLQGLVTNVDLEQRKVAVDTKKAEKVSLDYDVLIIASGTEAKWAGFQVNTDIEKARSAIFAANKALKKAKNVAVVGGGPTGVETAGEIAGDFKGVHVTLYSGSTGPLVAAAPKLSAKASVKLKEVGVEVVNNVKISNVAHSSGNDDEGSKSVITLANGEKKEYDLVFESYLPKPYSSFLPDSVLDKKGFVLTDSSLLVQGYSGVIALGDIVAGGSKSIVDIQFGQLGTFKKTFRQAIFEITSKEYVKGTGTVGKKGGKYSPITHTILVPISRKGGVGMVFRIPAPNFLVWFAKAKTYMMEQAESQFM